MEEISWLQFGDKLYYAYDRRDGSLLNGVYIGSVDLEN